MKIPLNWRFVFLVVLLLALGIREVALELRPSFLRPGLHLFAYVGNTKDGTVTAVKIVRADRQGYFDKEVTRVLTQWRFTPDDKEYIVEVPFQFRLTD